jgi:uncharacterized protein
MGDDMAQTLKSKSGKGNGGAGKILPPAKKYGANFSKAEKQEAFSMMFRTLGSELVSRTALAQKLGKSYFGSSGDPKRDLYKTLGYEVTPDFQSYYARYKRQDIAKAIVEALPNACWRLKPTISDTEKTDSKFEIEIAKIIRTKNVWHYLARGDRVAGIGQFAGVLMGFDDGQELSQPLKKATKLLFLRPYTQEFLAVQSFVEDTKNERFGLPETYKISAEETTSKRSEVVVHYTRMIHISEGLVEDDVYGTPRLECVLNRLQDLEMISGGSAEMFWRGAFPGFAFRLDSESQFDPDQLDEFEEEIQAYVNELRRYMRLQGMEVEALSTQVSDPSNHIDVLVTLIAAATRIPKRILLGSERGELSSSQDERAWIDRIDERRSDHLTVNVIRPFVDTLISSGVVPPPPAEDYTIEWPPLVVLGDSERLGIAKSAAETLAKYVSTPGLDQLIPAEMFLKKYMNFTDEEITQAKEMLGKDMDELLGAPSEEEEEAEEEGDLTNIPPEEEEAQEDESGEEEDKV